MRIRDAAAEKVHDELERHRKGANLLNPLTGEYGIWAMSADEAAGVARFLAEHHTKRRTSPTKMRPVAERSGGTIDAGAAGDAITPECKHCASTDLTARWGKYGYHWKCRGCGKNTTMPTVCRACGAVGHRGRKVRIRKDQASYFRECHECRHSERIWTEA